MDRIVFKTGDGVQLTFSAVPIVSLSKGVQSQGPCSELRLDVVSTWMDRDIPTNSKEWKILREEVLRRNNYACRFCGHQSSKFMQVAHLDGRRDDSNISNLGVNCQCCGRIIHCGFSAVHDLLFLKISELPQLEIVKKSRELYRKNRRNPSPEDIDPNSTWPPLTLIQYANELTVNRDNPVFRKETALYKGFFTPTFKGWQVDF